MKAKEKEQIKARHLRHRGFSLNEIASTLQISKSSASLWVKDIKLTKNQANFLKHKAHLKEVIQKRVATRIKNERGKRQIIINRHKDTIIKIKITSDKLMIIGSILYWAEGGKSDKSRMFKFSNSDPRMIQVMMSFLRKTCNIPENKFRGHIQLHPHLDSASAVKYWSAISDIPVSQFYKTSQSHNKRSKNIRDNLPFGTFNIEICSVDLYLKMLAWIEVINEKVTATYN